MFTAHVKLHFTLTALEEPTSAGRATIALRAIGGGPTILPRREIRATYHLFVGDIDG